MRSKVCLATGYLLFAGLLTACVPSATPTPPLMLATLPPVVTQAPTLDPALPTVTPTVPLAVTPSPALLPTADPSAATQAAIAALAHHLNIAESQIGFVAAAPQEWSDTSLGCPQPGQAYPPVHTAGYLVTLNVGDATYTVHTDLSGTAIVCSGESTESASDPLVREFMLAAKMDLAEDLGVPVELVAVVRSEAVDWSDSSLGCAEQGQEYAEVSVPGYRIILAVEEEWYEFHTDQERMFLCEHPTE